MGLGGVPVGASSIQDGDWLADDVPTNPCACETGKADCRKSEKRKILAKTLRIAIERKQKQAAELRVCNLPSIGTSSHLGDVG